MDNTMTTGGKILIHRQLSGFMGEGCLVEEIKLLIGNMPAAVIAVDKQMNYLAFSKTYLEQQGIREEDYFGRNHYEVVKDLPDRWKLDYKRCLEDGIPSGCEDDYFVRADGTVEYLKWEVQPIKDRRGEILGLFILLDSLNEQKQAERAAKESEARLSRVMSLIGEGVWDWDIPSGTIWNNQRWCEILEIPDCGSGHDVELFKTKIHPDDLTRVFNTVQACLENDVNYACEYRIVTPNKQIKWIKDRGLVTEKDANGKAIRMMGSISDITQQKNSEIKLKETSELLTKLTNQVPGMLYQFKLAPDGKVSFPYCSDGILDVLGLLPEYVKNDATYAIPNTHEDDKQKIFRTIIKSAAQQTVWEEEFRVNLDEKGQRWCLGVARPERLNDGSIIWHGYNLDITERKKLELERERYYQFFNASNDAMCIVDIHGCFELVNPFFCEQLGYSEEEMLHKPFSNYLHEDDIPRTLDDIRKSLNAGMELKLENRFRTRTGAYLWFSWRAYLDKSEGLVYATGRDITDKRQIQLALIESEKNMQAIFALTPIPLVVTQLYSGKVLLTNDATLHLLGVETQDVIGQPAQQFFKNSFDVQKLRREMYKKGQGEFVEVTLLNTQNEPRTCLISSEVIYIKGEIALLSTILDITERKAFEQALIEKNHELEKTNMELDKFVYSTSHDLRAPLLSVLGLIDLCTDQIKEGDFLYDVHEMMRASIHRLDNTIKDILDYSRNSRLGIDKEEVDVKEIIEQHINNIKHMKEAKHILFHVEVNQQSSYFTNKMRLTSIINNLITNAVKYQRKDNPQKEVRVLFDYEGSSAKLVVEDNGEGIPKEGLDQLFKMFVRLSTNSTGSGLGLYITKEMVEKLGGNIRVETQQNAGSRFIVNLPD